MKKPNNFIKCRAWEAILAAGISATAATASTAGTVGSEAAKNRKAYDNWQRQTALANFLNLENRIYNSPKNQMQRLIDAGINPNLVANNGMGNTAHSPDVPDIPRPHSVDYSGFANGVNDAMSKLIQVEAFKKQMDLNDQQIRESQAREKSYDALAQLNTAKSAIEFLRGNSYRDNDYFDSLTRTAAQKLIASVYQNGILAENLDFLIKSHPLLLEGYRRSNNLTNAKIANTKADTDLKKQSYLWNQVTWNKNYSLLSERVRRFASLNDLTDAQAGLVRARNNLMFDAALSKYEDKLFDAALNFTTGLFSRGSAPRGRASSSNYNSNDDFFDYWSR